MAIDATDFKIYQDFLYKESGYAIAPEKSYLLESRLNVVVKKMELEDFKALTAKIRANDPVARHNVIEAMTINETFFFRDTHPFDRFRDVILPKLVENKPAGSTIRIWCAACSSGQEPYSLAIILKENMAKYASYKFEIIATDLSEDILQVAKTGKYTQFEVQRGMPITLLIKYFMQEGSDWFIKDDIKSMVRFEKFNLMDSMAKYGTLDVIFCRNVLIYFDPDTKRKVLDELYKRCAKHGFLTLGGAETVVAVTDKFKPMPNERGLYLPHDSAYLT
jgi:chemotaxis protein methyltransferase CheR